MGVGFRVSGLGLSDYDSDLEVHLRYRILYSYKEPMTKSVEIMYCRSLYHSDFLSDHLLWPRPKNEKTAFEVLKGDGRG